MKNLFVYLDNLFFFFYNILLPCLDWKIPILAGFVYEEKNEQWG